MSVPSVTWAAHLTPAQRMLVASEETPGMNNLLWDPARGAVLAKKEEKSWRYLSGPAHGEPRPQGLAPPPPACKALSCSPHICHGRPSSWPITLHAFPF